MADNPINLICDSCGHQGMLVVRGPNYSDSYHEELTLCQHHGNRLVINLLIKGWNVILDRREWRAEGPLTAALPDPQPVS